MATTKLILTHEVGGLGEPGDVVEVKGGYARNYLVPRGYAIAWTRGGEKRDREPDQDRRLAHRLGPAAPRGAGEGGDHRRRRLRTFRRALRNSSGTPAEGSTELLWQTAPPQLKRGGAVCRT